MVGPKVILLLLLSVQLTTIAGRKGKKGKDSHYECMNTHLCKCTARELDAYEECWNDLTAATIDYAIAKVNKKEICKGYNGTMKSMPFKEHMSAYCALSEVDKKECYDDLNREMKTYMKEMTMSFDLQQQEELEGLQKCGMCLQPHIIRCRDSDPSCM